MRGRQTTKTQPRHQGFTIVEVMIVLAVTGLLFVSVAIAISGKQQSAQFQTSMNEARSQIQQVASEVTNGYFPTNGDTIQCQAIGTTVQVTSKTAGTASFGGCNFIGKALHFYDGDGNTDSKIFSVYSLLGADTTSGGYTSATPIIVSDANTQFGGTPINPDHIDVTTRQRLNYGLKASTMTFTSSSTGTKTPIGSFAFAQSINNSVDGTNTGGSQHLNIIGFTQSGGNSRLSNKEADEADALNQQLNAGTSAYSVGGTVELCFISGGTNQHGIVSIGSDAGQLDVSANIENGSSC